MLAVEIKDQNSFEAWLNARPKANQKAEAVALAHRCAMRILPFARRWGKRSLSRHVALLKNTMWCNTISRVASTYPTREIADAAYAAAVYADDAADAAYAAAADAAYAAYAAADDDAAAAAAAAAAADDAIWEQLRLDAAYIERGGAVAALMVQPLWQKTPQTWEKETHAFKQFLQSPDMLQQGFDLWEPWYNAAVNGTPAFGIRNADLRNTLERNIALGSTDGTFNKQFWDREAAAVNADIKRWVEEARAAEVKAVGSEDFQSVPATIETTVRNGQVDVLHEVPHSDLARTTRDAALADLQTAFEELAKLAAERNASRGLVEALNAFSKNIAAIQEDQARLFAAGRFFKQLQASGKTIEDEWDSFSAAGFHATVLQLEQTLDHFTSWKNFKKSPPQLAKPAEIKQTATAAIELGIQIHALPGVLTISLKARLDQLMSNIKAWQNDNLSAEINSGVEEQGQLLLADVALSLINITKSLARIVYGKTIKPFADGVSEQLPDSSKELGKKLVKWTAVGGPLYGLAMMFPEATATLMRIIQVLK